MNEEIKAASVDSPEFRKLLDDVFDATIVAEDDEQIAALIAHINAWADERCNQLAASRAMLPVTDSRLTDEQLDTVHQGANAAAAWRNHELAAKLRAIATSAASPVAGWVSVEERLPEDDQEVFVLYWPYNNKENKQIIGGAKYWDGSFYTHDGDEHHPPSHWYPAPPAPVVTPTQQEQSNG